MQAVAAVLLMLDPRDLGWFRRCVRRTTRHRRIYLYEAVPGASDSPSGCTNGTAELVAGAADLIAGCACVSGCPACTGAAAGT